MFLIIILFDEYLFHDYNVDNIETYDSLRNANNNNKLFKKLRRHEIRLCQNKIVNYLIESIININYVVV